MKAEKEAAMAAKRAKFDKMFPMSGQVQQKLDTNNNGDKPKKWDPLIDKEDRDKAWNLGHSLDSKKVTSALGYLDLKQICYCLAQALNKHIQFSQGHFFLNDLQEYVKQKKLEESQANFNNMKGEELEFTYNLGDNFKIDIEGAKKRKVEREEREQESKKNFEELKKQMEESAKTPVIQTSEKLQSSEVRQKPPVDEDADEIEDEVGDSLNGDDGIEDFYGDDTFKDGTIKSKVKAAGDAADDIDNLDDDDKADEEDFDLDYSQTQLDDFLKSNMSSSMMKGTNIQSGQLLNSFLSTYNKMKGSNSLQGTVDQTGTNLGTRKNSA